MVVDIAREVEIIVNALLQVSDKVVEVSKDHTITRIWDSPSTTIGNSDQYIGKKIADVRNDSIVKQCDDLVARSFAVRDNGYIQYTPLREIINRLHTAYASWQYTPIKTFCL